MEEYDDWNLEVDDEEDEDRWDNEEEEEAEVDYTYTKVMYSPYGNVGDLITWIYKNKALMIIKEIYAVTDERGELVEYHFVVDYHPKTEKYSFTIFQEEFEVNKPGNPLSEEDMW